MVPQLFSLQLSWLDWWLDNPLSCIFHVLSKLSSKSWYGWHFGCVEEHKIAINIKFWCSYEQVESQLLVTYKVTLLHPMCKDTQSISGKILTGHFIMYAYSVAC